MYKIILTGLVIHDLFVYVKPYKLSIMSHKGLYFKWKVKCMCQYVYIIMEEL
jgi:hypothetical protein